MKKTITLFWCVCICLIFVGCSDYNNPILGTGDYSDTDLPAIIASMNMPRPVDSYNYPVYPGMKEWKDFKSVKEATKASEIPIKKVRSQSTQALIQGIWEYPYAMSILLHNDYQFGYDGIFGKLNVYRELLSRKDAAQCLLTRLLVVDETSFTYMGAPVMMLMHMAQYPFLNQLNKGEKKQVLKRTLEMWDIWDKENMEGWDNKRQFATYLAARTLKCAGYKPLFEELALVGEKEDFCDTFYMGFGSYVHEGKIIDFWDTIMDHAQAFLSE